MKDINFKNKVFIDTDYMGQFYYDQHKVLGWKDYANGICYNLDEVKELFKQGKAGDNVKQKEDGELYMSSQYCSSVTVGRIVCGILVKGDRNGKNKNLYDYAEKQGWITQKPRPIKMTSFKKELEINKDGTYNIILSLFKEKFKDLCSYDYLEKICIGAIKKLKYDFCVCYGKETKIERKYNCGDIIFDKEKLQMIIKDIPKNYIGLETNTLRCLDLELEIMTTKKYNTYDIETASIDAIRDEGQYHWLHESEEKYKELSNIFWFDKDEQYYIKKSEEALNKSKGIINLEDWYKIEKGTKIYYKDDNNNFIGGYFAGINYFDEKIIFSKISEDDWFTKLKMTDYNVCDYVDYKKVKLY